jgi:glycosyltransferase involved in cell wall biosynthesis
VVAVPTPQQHPAADQTRPRLSVIVPAYNEESRLGGTLDAIVAHLSDAGLSYELIVVDDGSTDGTADVVGRRPSACPQVRLLRNETNRGKGYSVRRGMQEARGELVLFADADNSTPIQQLETLLAAIDQGADIAIGSRGLPESVLEVRQPAYREYMGRIFNLIVRLLTRLPFRDTQCGFKLFRRDVARDLASRQTLDRWAFDVELLHLAVRKRGYTVAEVPVRWVNSPRTTLNALTDSLDMLREVLRIKWQDLRRRYE